MVALKSLSLSLPVDLKCDEGDTMKKLQRISLFFSLIACAMFFTCGQVLSADNGKKISHVVIIGVDGGGAFFKEADTPNLDKIFENGAVSYEVITSKPTISAQCWGSMLHGVTPEFHGLTNGIVSATPYPEDSLFPSVFRVVRENDPDAILASFCNWNPINIGIIENNLGVVKGTAKGDDAVTDLVCDYLKDNVPTLLFVQFDDCDGAGHSVGYGTEGHLKQINTTDGYIQRIYEACEKQGMLDSTLFVVTADHGGFERSHGGWTDGEKKIMFAAAGPGVAKGTIGEMGVRDTASVALYALGLADKQPESWTSRVPSGLFEGVTAVERPVYTIKYAYPHRTHEVAPTPTGDASAPAALGKDRVLAYFPFDGNIKDALGKVETKQTGKLYYIDGYFGKGAQFDDGFVSILDYKPGKSSFSVAFWMKTSGVDEDPAILSNKNWGNGTTAGYVLALRPTEIRFNVGKDGKRMDTNYQLPIDYCDGWVYVVLVVDREAKEVRFSYDFKNLQTAKIPEDLVDVSFDCFPVLNIGQDGTGKYRVNVGAELDEVMLINGVLTDKDVAALKGVYVKE